jgi:hypothetical protein
VSELAALALEVGRLHPHRRGRADFLQRRRPELWERLLQASLVEEDPEEPKWDADVDSSGSPMTEDEGLFADGLTRASENIAETTEDDEELADLVVEDEGVPF